MLTILFIPFKCWCVQPLVLIDMWFKSMCFGWQQIKNVKLELKENTLYSNWFINKQFKLSLERNMMYNRRIPPPSDKSFIMLHNTQKGHSKNIIHEETFIGNSTYNIFRPKVQYTFFLLQQFIQSIVELQRLNRVINSNYDVDDTENKVVSIFSSS